MREGASFVVFPVKKTRLVIEDVFECRSSARQRCGRAGRVAPGPDGTVKGRDDEGAGSWQFFVTFLGWLSGPFKWLSDLQLGHEKVTA